jgi:hypothetical protein
MQKFQVNRRRPEKVEPDKENVSDPFYDLLKRRVAAALMQHGMDLKKDRCAPPIRVAYYTLIAFCLAISAAAHIRVRSEIHAAKIFVVVKCDASTNSICFVVLHYRDLYWVRSSSLSLDG